MAIKVRDYLENYGYKVGYDEKSGGVLVTDSTGKTKNIGNKGLTLNEGSYYAGSADDINRLLGDAGVVGGTGYGGVRNELTKRGANVGWIDDGTSKLLSVNGRNYNPADGNFINIDGTLYAKNSYIDSLADTGYKSPYAGKIEKGLADIEKRRFNYDPENDPELAAAQRSAIDKVQQQLNSQGVLNSSLNALYSQRAAQELVPEYSRMAYERYLDEEQSDYGYLNALLGLDAKEYEKYTDSVQTDLSNRTLTAQREDAAAGARSQKYYDTVEKIRTTGFVTNEDSLVTGLPAGQVDGETMARLDSYTANIRLGEAEQENRIEFANIESQLENDRFAYQSAIELGNQKELETLKNDFEQNILRLSSQLEAEVYKTNAGIDHDYAMEILKAKYFYEASILGIESELEIKTDKALIQNEIEAQKEMREIEGEEEKK